MTTTESNRIRDKIIEILEQNGSDVKAVYPLLHWIEGEIHECDKRLQTNKDHAVTPNAS